MNNYEVINKFNNKTKNYLNYVFSIYDYIRNNNFRLKLLNDDGDIYDCELSEVNDILALAFFISILEVDDTIKGTFEFSNINMDTLNSTIVSDSAQLKDFKITEDMSECDSFDSIDLATIFKTIIDTFKYKYNIALDEDIDYFDINPSIIFDYMYDYYGDVIGDVTDSISISDASSEDQETSDRYNEYITKEINQVLEKYNIEPITSALNDYISEICFGNINILNDNGELYFVSSNGKPVTLSVKINHEDVKLEISNMTKIISIDGNPNITNEFFETYADLFDDENIDDNKDIRTEFEIYDADTRSIVKFSVKMAPLIDEVTTKVFKFKKMTVCYDPEKKEARIFTYNGENIVIPGLTDDTTYTIRDNSILESINDEEVTEDLLESLVQKGDTNKRINLIIYDTEADMAFDVNTNTSSILLKGEEEFNTPMLNKYGTNLTEKNYIKNPCISREKEMDDIITILLYPEKDRSIIITGDSGVGKTALIEGLCYKIQNGDVPNSLKDIKIISISPTSLVAGTKYVGTLEERMDKITKEASKDKNIILFIDEVHQIIGAGVSEGNDNSVAEMLKQYLDRGDIRIIGATTTDEYYKYVEPNTAFKRRLERVHIKEPADKAIYIILDNLITAYNKISDANPHLR